MKPHVRWMITNDIPSVLAIEQASLEHPWPEEAIVANLRRRNCIGMVAEHRGRVVGFTIYALHSDYIDVLKLVVHPGSRRQGIGRALITAIKDKLSAERRKTLEINVPETSLGAALFLRALGLKARLCSGELLEAEEDFYQFSCHVEAEVACTA
jgi:[ribosomal protein S18]-alanine N-acetyltransferase